MSGNPKVSIIINNYNYGRFLRETIESALNQTYPETEVIVVDDGSTDDSREVIRNYGEQVRPVFKENGGQGSTFNAGYEISRGKVVIYLDSDDVLEPTALEKIVPCFEDPQVVKVQWLLTVIDGSGEPMGEVIPPRTPPEGDIKDEVLEFGPLYDWNDFPPCSGNAWRNTFLKEVFPMPEPPYRNGADVYLIVLAPLYGRLRTLPLPLGRYRAHGGNNFWNKALDNDRIRNYIQRFETSCAALHHQARQLGIDVDPAVWKARNFNYLWPTRLLRAREDIQRLLPPGSRFALIDEAEWGRGEPIPDRTAVIFNERDGAYWGPPTDDEAAIRELERLRDSGAEYLVLWWTAFWWLEHYTEMSRHLDTHYSRILDDDHLKVYNLRSVGKEHDRHENPI
ncbi:MAG: glycosyltransferase family 2 protein [Armatimonadetes bacterium]|nr:glycosyltransferase family 2 protein [Armatimonadota bacterium]